VLLKVLLALPALKAPRALPGLMVLLALKV
jgi:hypothetical protein